MFMFARPLAPRVAAPDQTPLAERDAQVTDRRTLPLQAISLPSPSGLFLRLPVRREEVRVEKQTVVVEEVLVRRQQVENVLRVDESVQREDLRLDTEGDVEIPGLAEDRELRRLRPRVRARIRRRGP